MNHQANAGCALQSTEKLRARTAVVDRAGGGGTVDGRSRAPSV